MRRSATLLIGLIAAATMSAQTRVTVRQLEVFLLSPQAQKESDATLATQLASIQLSQQLTDARLASLAFRLRVGPQSAEQIELIAAASIFEPPPPADLVSKSPPDAGEQLRILQAAQQYAKSFARRLPDFLGLRSTRSFDNAPQLAGKKHKPVIRIHFVGERHRQVTVRAGQEVSASQPSSEASYSDHAEGMTTWGEFGPLLTTVLGDLHAGSIAWSRWQNEANGARLAVFRYAIPRPDSHDLIDLDSYSKVPGDPRTSQDVRFRDDPPYHGDLYIDPSTGGIVRVTIDAELAPDAPVLVAQLAVDYAPVDIGGITYLCPVRGIAVSVVHNPEMEAIEGGGPERFVNLVLFTEYHKFGSTSRIVPNN